MRSEHANDVTPKLRDRMALRLVGEFGTPEAAADSVWALARGNGWYREGERPNASSCNDPPPPRCLPTRLLSASWWLGTACRLVVSPMTDSNGAESHPKASRRCLSARVRQESYHPSSNRFCPREGSKRSCGEVTCAMRRGELDASFQTSQFQRVGPNWRLCRRISSRRHRSRRFPTQAASPAAIEGQGDVP